jgi:hypothetical protein
LGTLDIDLVARSVRQCQSFPSPELLDDRHLAQHLVPAVGKDARRQGEVVDVPPGGKRDAYAPVGKIVEHRPFLGDTDRVLQWKDDAAGANLQALGRHGEGGSGDRRVRVQTSEWREVSLGGPHRRKTVVVTEPRGFEKQSIFRASCALCIRREEEDTELEWRARGDRAAHVKR